MNNQNECLQRSYTGESLRMLESEEGQLNAVFACFGSAVQHAQLFEQGLARFLAMYNKVASHSINIEDIEHRKTMGQLLDKFGRHITIEDKSIEEGFATALRERNYLAHHFFLERNSALESNEGRRQLLSELTRTEANLDRCRVAINAMRIAMCKALGIEDDWAQDYSR